MNQTNSKAHRPKPNLGSVGFQPGSPASSEHSLSPISLPAFKLLDFLLSHRKHSTSQFLIDNFRALSWFRVFPASSFEPLASRISNRHIPELESLVSHRKQRIAPLSNRHKIAFCNSRFRHPIGAPIGFAKQRPHSRLSTFNSQLLSNRQSPELEMHLSHRKQRTENFLIAKFRLILHSGITFASQAFSFSSIGSQLRSAGSDHPKTVSFNLHLGMRRLNVSGN